MIYRVGPLELSDAFGIGLGAIKDDSGCRALGGTCRDKNQETCDGSWKTDLCPGESNIVCCVPGSAKKSSPCEEAGGTCRNKNKEKCSGTWVKNLCPGQPDHIVCCVKEDPCKSEVDCEKLGSFSERLECKWKQKAAKWECKAKEFAEEKVEEYTDPEKVVDLAIGAGGWIAQEAAKSYGVGDDKPKVTIPPGCQLTSQKACAMLGNDFSAVPGMPADMGICCKKSGQAKNVADVVRKTLANYGSVRIRSPRFVMSRGELLKNLRVPIRLTASTAKAAQWAMEHPPKFAGVGTIALVLGGGMLTYAIYKKKKG